MALKIAVLKKIATDSDNAVRIHDYNPLDDTPLCTVVRTAEISLLDIYLQSFLLTEMNGYPPSTIRDLSHVHLDF